MLLYNNKFQINLLSYFLLVCILVRLRLLIDNVPLRYPDQISEISTVMRNFQDYLDRFQQSKVKLDTISEQFTLGTLQLLQGDLNFEAGQHKESLLYFKDSIEKFQYALSLQSGKPDEVGELTSEVIYELQRRTTYAQSRISHADALVVLKEAGKGQLDLLLNNFELAAKNYQTEIDLERKADDFSHLILSLRNLFLVYIRIAELQSEISTNDFQIRRRGLYFMISHALKANFLGATIPPSFFERIRQTIKHLTLEKFQERADWYWGTGLVLSTDHKYNQAAQFFYKGWQLYKEMKKLEDNIEFNIQGEMMYVTALEHEGRAKIEADENIQGSDFFAQASSHIRKLISTVRELGNTDLLRHFSIQNEYFTAMNLFCQGLISYDNEKYVDALKQLQGSKKILTQVNKSSQELNNNALIVSCKEGIQKCNTYIETVSLLITDDVSSGNTSTDPDFPDNN